MINAPGMLDLYMWLSYRCKTVGDPVAVPLFGEHGLAGQLGMADQVPKRMRQTLRMWLTKIKPFWPEPELPAYLSEDGESLILKHGINILPEEGHDTLGALRSTVFETAVHPTPVGPTAVNQIPSDGWHDTLGAAAALGLEQPLSRSINRGHVDNAVFHDTLGAVFGALHDSLSALKPQKHDSLGAPIIITPIVSIL
jgi:hypothetical protein